MSAALVIVESPAKARTLNRYLGDRYKVMASNGHVRDLLPKSGAVEPEKDFEMRYEIIDRNAKAVDAIAKALKKSGALYLATDPDREGEAISWHLYELLKDKGVLKEKEVKRVVFHEVTRSAILEAMNHPRELSWDLINAQQARRALDYLVGFNLSPLLWKKIRTGLSAGRVQSPALRMIVEREEEIEKFQPREYWTIEADLNRSKTDFTAKLFQFENEKIKQFTVTDERRAKQVVGALEKNADGVLIVSRVDKKKQKRQPPPPFITSTLQQEAVRKLGFTAQNTMRTAQQLYEGIDVGTGAVGLITYMRTDSVSLAAEAIDQMRGFISKTYGDQFLPERPRRYKTRSKNAQEAHEAIRPTSIGRTPGEIKTRLSPEQFKLYDLIWKRALASQMAHALIDTVAVDLACGSDANLFRANGSRVVEKGFMVLYREGEDDKARDSQGTDDRKLPPMEVGDRVTLLQIRPEQHFTEPPPRFSEASLVKSLEEYGIGRPSTYASIISTLRNREYVEMDNKRFIPTDVGRIVNKFLTEHFIDYVDYDFTAKLEDELDAVSRGEKEWVPMLKDFWTPFSRQVKDKEGAVSRSEATSVRILGDDPETGRPVSVRVGRYGAYVQIGTKDDDEKPRFASLRPGQAMNTIELEEALALSRLPRDLGVSEEGEKIVVNIGRLGPYVRYGDNFVSLEKQDDPCTIELDRALDLVRKKKKADAESRLPRDLGVSEEGEKIVVNIGRFGPYVRYDDNFVSLEKQDDPYTIELDRALVLVRKKKKADAEKQIKTFKEEGISVLNGRYGPYITDGKKNVKIPGDREPGDLTLKECQALIANAPSPRKRRKRKAG